MVKREDEEVPLCRECWLRHWYADACIPGSAAAIRKRKSRALNRERDRAYQRAYMRKRDGG